ncbi:MAG TPA: hypothetical protein PKU94_01920 [Candidatus Hydrothermia bacterium]|nr:hypothetical protein [Candidatus Hydrothermia bacterium]
MSCGLFLYVGHEKLKFQDIYNFLKELETLQEPEDSSPLGGHGAGFVMLSDSLVPYYKKVGYFENRSSVDALFDSDELKNIANSNFFLGHVRRASDEFSSLEELDELHAQPFVHSDAHCRVYCAHNGFLKNYADLKNRLGIEEFYTDSDVLCQLLLALLERFGEISRACEELFSMIDGDNTAIFFVEKREQFWLVVLHIGKTRGLVVNENEMGEMVIASRRAPLYKYFGELIEKKGFFESLYIKPKEHRLFINWWKLKVNPPFSLSEY